MLYKPQLILKCFIICVKMYILTARIIKLVEESLTPAELCWPALLLKACSYITLKLAGTLPVHLKSH